SAHAGFLIAPVLLIAFSAYNAVVDVHQHHWAHLFFAGLNAALAAYAIMAFVGLRNTIVDLWVQLRGWLYRPVSPRVTTEAVAGVGRSPALNARSGAIGQWASVLHYGTPGTGTRMVSTRTADAGDGIAARQGQSERRTPAGSVDSTSFQEYTFF